jgi:hypothetical protein
MPLTPDQMALMSRLLDAALPLDEAALDPLLAGLKDDPRYDKLLKELELSN